MDRIARWISAPIIFLMWAVKRVGYYRTRKTMIMISERLSARPVSLEEALALTAHYIEKNGREWQIPLVEEIEKSIKGNEHFFTHYLWSLDSGRFWTRFRPSDKEISPGFDISITGPEEQGKGHVHLIRYCFFNGS